MQAAFYTLGCKVNQNETDALMELFRQAGFAIVSSTDDADVYIVNSCTVTAGGDKKSLQWLRHAKRRNPDAVTVLTGCYPQAFPELAVQAAEADIVTGSRARRRIVDDVLQFLQTKQRIVDIVPHERGEAFEEMPLTQIEGHTRAFLKIEDGCNRQCAYCVIPRARGRVRSRSESSILQELKTLAVQGYREAVFSGINLSSYGTDTGTSLAEIVEKASRIDGLERIRLGSLEPDLMDDDCIARLAKTEKLCPQFHLSLQSGCDKTLAAMRRIYRTDEYLATVQKLRSAIPGCVFTTDVIVGFPGETEEDFLQSMAFVREIGFLKVHVFSYSRRSGTPAYDMPQQIEEGVKAQRSRKLQAAADEVRREIISAMRGTAETVLLEKPVNRDTFTGYTRTYVPVTVKAPGCCGGQIVPVTLGEFDGERCRTQIIE